MNLANLLTCLRLLLAPIIIWAVLGGRDLLVLASFALACATDMADGWVARKTGKVTTLGIVLDPIADKTVILSALLTGAAIGKLPWWLALAYLAKELLQLLGGAVILRRGHAPIAANRYGKNATVLTFTGFFLLWLGVSLGWWFILAGLLLGVFAAFTYLRAGLRGSGAKGA